MVCIPFHMSPELRPADAGQAHGDLNELQLPTCPMAPPPCNLERGGSAALSEAGSLPCGAEPASLGAALQLGGVRR
jgi:hypothetical protein